jgi:UPF0755 protein
VLAAALMVGLAFGYVFFLSSTPSYNPEDGQSAVLRIDSGMTFSDVTTALDNVGMVGNQQIFRLKARIYGYDRQIKAGVYLIEAGEKAEDVLKKMADGEVAPSLKVTIPEGYNIRQIAVRLETAGILEAESFLEAMKDYRPAGLVLPTVEYPIEGFLFPDTYVFAPQDSPVDVADKMYQRFLQVVGDDYTSLAAKRNLTLLQAVTLASIIEKEIRVASERELAAGVFLRRISIRMPLQSCATVQYLLPEPKENLTYADLKIESPYNTYLHPGFPPGPIANPGKGSLMAVINPQDEGYLYFVAKKDGSHVFSKTLAEHNAAKNRINNE